MPSRRPMVEFLRPAAQKVPLGPAMKFFLTHLLAFLLFLASATLSGRADIQPAAAPTAQQVRSGKLLAEKLRTIVTPQGQMQPLLVSRSEAEASVALLRHALNIPRMRLRTGEGRWQLHATLPVGRSWLNLSGDMMPGAGADHWRGRMGYVPLPSIFVRGAVSALGRLSAPPMPNARHMVRIAALTPHMLVARVGVSHATLASVQSLAAPQAALVDAPSLVRVYQKLCARETARPSTSLAQIYRRASLYTPRTEALQANRLVLLSVAMFVVGPASGRLAAADVQAPPCVTGHPPVQWQGRDDLPKHFTLSAALMATTDPRVTAAMGEWKEMDDSLPGGSGFSFVDLAADHAGASLGAAAVDPAQAPAMQGFLARVQMDQLLPVDILSFEEGLRAETFHHKYGSLDAPRYRAARAYIDALLAKKRNLTQVEAPSAFE